VLDLKTHELQLIPVNNLVDEAEWREENGTNEYQTQGTRPCTDGDPRQRHDRQHL
jgi:hypothetical protein